MLLLLVLTFVVNVDTCVRDVVLPDVYPVVVVLVLLAMFLPSYSINRLYIKYAYKLRIRLSFLILRSRRI